MRHAPSIADASSSHRCASCYQPLPDSWLGVTRQDEEHADAFGMSCELYSALAGADFREENAFVLAIAQDLRVVDDGDRSSGLGSQARLIQLTTQAPTLVLAIGVDTGLAVRDALVDRNLAIWAVRTAAALAVFSLPTWAEEIVVAADNYPSDRDAADRLSRRCAERGLPCRLMLPPAEYASWRAVAQAEVAA